MDIRKWLTSPKIDPSSTSKAAIRKNGKKKITKDVSLSNHSQESQDLKKRNKKRMIILDSDSDEDPLPKIKKTSPKRKLSESDVFHISADLKNVSSEDPQNKYTELKPTTSAKFFGDAPVVRPSRQFLEKKQQLSKNDNATHEDDDFNKTLLELDEEEKKVKAAVEKKRKGNRTRTETYDMNFVKHKALANDVMQLIPNTMTESSKIEVKNKDATEESSASKKRANFMLYKSFLDREGPRALGSKEIPQGKEGCLEGLSFMITGILESIERDDAKALIEKYGGKVMASLTKNTKYVVIGRDPGPSKIEKAEKFGTKQLDEDGLLKLIEILPGKKQNLRQSKTNSVKRKPVAEACAETPCFEINEDPVKKKGKIITEEVVKKEKTNAEDVDLIALKKAKTSPAKMEFFVEDMRYKNVSSECTEKPVFEMWVDKYKPPSLKQVIGQQGDRSNAKKLLQWLLNWNSKPCKSKKPSATSRWNSLDDGLSFKAALLSGSPGIGKTTTAQLACKEAGFDFFELNASDARSKKNLDDYVSQLLGNQTLSSCFKASSSSSITKNHVIIMDEVDGMAGNEDRGGVKELITLIKTTHVPIICICNDRNHPKIRSLSNYCFDLRFQKPRAEQIKAAMMSIAYKEGIKITPDVLQEVIIASNQDIRQVLHNLSLWSAKEKELTYDQARNDIGKGFKNIKMGPFDVLREVFAIGNNPKATIFDKSALFFHDYSLAPLFVQENYVHVQPNEAGGDKLKHLRLLSEAADSICDGDLIDKQIRTGNSWSLLPSEAIFASVIPGELMKGHLKQMISFPSWLGKNSNKNHMDRILQELQMHMRMRITGNKTEVVLDYLPLLKHSLTYPLLTNENEGIHDTVNIMNYYSLLREDFDSIIGLSLWPQQTDPRSKISTKVKSAFTRAYNKNCGQNPYCTANVAKKKKVPNSDSQSLNEENEDNVSEEDNEDDSLENDAMIKIKKPSKKVPGPIAEDSNSTSKKAKSVPNEKKKKKICK